MRARQLRIHFVVLSFLLFLAACTTGPMTIRETHYYRVSNGDNSKNYYRLRIHAQTKLGVSEYRSGWFPARSVDMLFGNTSSEGGVAALEVRSKIEEQINRSILSTNEAWLSEAGNPNADHAKLGRLLAARKRILAYPRRDGPPFRGAVEIEYNPATGVVTLHSDEKLLFVLSSNPEEVIGKIANFSENDKTVLSINRLSNLTAQRARDQLAAQEARAEVNDKFYGLVRTQIQHALTAAQDGSSSSATLIQEIDTLLALLDSVQP